MMRAWLNNEYYGRQGASSFWEENTIVSDIKYIESKHFWRISISFEPYQGKVFQGKSVYKVYLEVWAAQLAIFTDDGTS